MPLPFLLIGLASAAGLIGVGGGLSAKSDFDDAERFNNDARDLFSRAKKSLKTAHDKTKQNMEACGKTKLEVFEKIIIPFCRAARRVKNIELNKIMIEMDGPVMSDQEMKELDDVSIKMEEVVAGGVGALGAGGLAGLAAYGGTMTLATASTGTAIGALSGVAATNATLAWLGGGSLAAGGLGMAGGMAVLGGIVAAPVLLVGGLLMASKASEAREKAEANLALAQKHSEEMKTAEVAVTAIGERFEQIMTLLDQLQSLSETIFERFVTITTKKTNYKKFTVAEKQVTLQVFSIAKVIKSVLDSPVLTQNGKLVRTTANVIADAQTFCKQLG